MDAGLCVRHHTDDDKIPDQTGLAPLECVETIGLLADPISPIEMESLHHDPLPISNPSAALPDGQNSDLGN
jgi:hypothetical protein